MANEMKVKPEISQLALRVPRAVKKVLKMDSAEAEVSINDMVGLVLESFLREHPGEKDRVAFYRHELAKRERAGRAVESAGKALAAAA